MTDSIYQIAIAGFEAARELPGRPLHGHSFKLSALSAKSSIHKELDLVKKSLNYKYLNDISNVTSDVGLALKIAEQLPSATELRLQSAPGQGGYLADGQALLWRQSRFEAAHYLPNVPEGHKCGRLHGHGFQVVLFAKASSSQAQLQAQWQPMQARLHQRYMNEIDGLENPTSEVLAQWLWFQMKPSFDDLALVVVQETVTAGCSFDGEQHRIWKQQDAECAIYIPSQDQPMGHSYTVKLHLQAPLDDVMGWTVDYGDVKSLFKPVYDRLDHHCINDLISGVEPTVDNIALWLKSQLQEALPQLYRIDLIETPERGALIEWQKPMASNPRLMI